MEISDKEIEDILEKYSPAVYRLAYSRTKNVHDAQDIMQEVFLQYIKSDKTFNDGEHLKAWLLTVTVNMSKNLLTTAWARHRADETDMNEAVTDGFTNDKSDVYYAVMKLPYKYRTVVHLYYYEEYSVKEISTITGSKESTVKSLMHRARKMLRGILEEEYDYEI